jgi:hypothetical protein
VQAQEVLRCLGRHVVAIAGTYRWVNEDGTIENKDRFFAIAVCLFAVGDKWFMITAGHCIDEYLKLVKSPRVVITGRVLVDYFGTGAPHHDPIPYNLEDWRRPRHHDSLSGGRAFGARRRSSGLVLDESPAQEEARIGARKPLRGNQAGTA